jgi:hypothetical protein
MPDDLNLTSLASSPVPALAPAADIRARGEQRSRRSRAVIAGTAALVVLAGAGTAVALADHGRPNSLVPADPSGSAEPSATPAPVDEADPVSWAAFPTLATIRSIVPGDWVSGPVESLDGSPGDYDRCDVTRSLDVPQPGIHTRGAHTVAGTAFAWFELSDYGSAGAATTVLRATASGIRTCPTVTTDGPGAGSQETSAVESSTADGFVVTKVDRECQRDHADCHDSTSRYATVRIGHLLVTVTSAESQGITLPSAQVDALARAFASAAESGYGHPTAAGHADTVEPVIGSTLYAAVLTSDRETVANAREHSVTLGYPGTRLLPVRCLNGLAQQLPGETDQVAAAFFTTADDAEVFTNGWDDSFEGVAKVTVRCLS